MYNYTLGILKMVCKERTETPDQCCYGFFTLVRCYVMNFKYILLSEHSLSPDSSWGVGGTEACSFVSVQVITYIFFLPFLLVQHTFLRGWELKIFSKAFMN